MESKKFEGFEVEIVVEELEDKVAPGWLVWPFPGGGSLWGGR